MTLPRNQLIKIQYLIPVLTLILVGCTRSQLTPSPTIIVEQEQVEVTSSTDRPASGAPEGGSLPSQNSALIPGAQSDLDSLLDLTQYDIELVIDYEGHTFQGRSQVDYTNTEDVPIDSLYFRLLPNGHNSYGNGSLSVSQVRVDGKPVETKLSLSDTVLEVTLPEPLAVGEQARLDFDYSGVVPVDFGGDEAPAGYGIYNFSEGVLTLSGWYPILAVYDEDGWNLDPVSPIGDSVYSDTALYSIEVIADSYLSIAATGVEIDRGSSGETTHHRMISGPVRDFFLIMSPDFRVKSTQVDGTQVNSYYLPGHEAGGEAALSITADSLRVFNEHFGVYPFTELDVVDAPMRHALGVEYPAIFLVASGLYEEPDQPSFIVATAHEVAHQWWYSVVGNDVFDEPWLDEALTTYSSSLYYQDVLGKESYQGIVDYWQGRYDSLLEDGGDEPITQDLAYFENVADPGSYGGVVYIKGALFFKALRDEIGDEAFFAALQAYYQDHKHQIARGDDLLSAFERASGRSLDGFLQKWLYSAEG